MRVGILTPDSPRENLAAMKISAYHKREGHEVWFNFPLAQCDVTYASVLFQGTDDPIADIVGGPKYPQSMLPPEIDAMFPDYSLYPEIGYSLGYTYRGCPRTCSFCVVPKMCKDERHHSIHTFHDPRFRVIRLLNNNTLADPDWRDTFMEIEKAGLALISEGFDARLITDDVASWFARIKIHDKLQVAWDVMEHEDDVLRGIVALKRHIPRQFEKKRLMCYVLIGNGTTEAEDLHRVMVLAALGAEPFVMCMNRKDKYQSRFSRWVNRKAVFNTVRWDQYNTARWAGAERLDI